MVAKMTNNPVDADEFAGRLAQNTVLKVSPSTADTARAAVLLASDGARMMTGAVLNASASAVWD
jgi:3-oxoacyl-[acyl-carrier protein] reductase